MPGIADVTEQTDFQVLTENSMDIIMRIGPDLRANYVSPSSLKVLGWKPEEMLGRPASDFVLPEYLASVSAAATRLLADEVEQATTPFRIRRKDNEPVWVEVNARTIRNVDTGEPGDIVLIMRDITERKHLEERLAATARTDGLTGLANRRAFDEALEREWHRTLRGGIQISLLLLDIDHFKRFNDHYGHQVGDDCLRAVAATIKRTAQRPADLVARYGGEELAVILPETDLDGAVMIAEQIRKAIVALHLPHTENAEGGGWVTASIGVATALARVGGTMRMPESLLSAADSALYKAKHDGRNCTVTALLLTPDESV